MIYTEMGEFRNFIEGNITMSTYSGLAHTPTSKCQHYIWAWDGQRLIDKPIENRNDQHGLLWPELTNNFRGRFDCVNKQINVVPPSISERIPRILTSALFAKYGPYPIKIVDTNLGW